MSAFDDVKLGWKGKEFTIPARKVLGAVARIEEVLTLQELTGYAAKNTAPMAKIAQAYAAVLRYAGAEIDGEEVYAGMFGGDQSQTVIMDAVNALMFMMIPPQIRKKIEAGEKVEDKPVLATGEKPAKPGNSRATAKAASKRSSRSQSRKAGAQRQNSGALHR